MDNYNNIYAQDDEYYQYQYDHDRHHYDDSHADTNSSPDYEDYRYNNSRQSEVNSNSVEKSPKKINADGKYTNGEKILIFVSLSILIPFALFCVISIVVGVISGDAFP